MPGWRSCTECHQVLCQKGSQEKCVIILSPLGAGPWLVLPVLHNTHSTVGHFQIWQWQTAGRCSAEYTLDMAPCVASKKDFWELQLSEPHIPAELLAAATRPMNIAEILDITTWSWQEMPCMMDCFVWLFAWFRQSRRLRAFWQERINFFSSPVHHPKQGTLWMVPM